MRFGGNKYAVGGNKYAVKGKMYAVTSSANHVGKPFSMCRQNSIVFL